MKPNHKLNTIIFLSPSIVTVICSIVSLPFLTQKLDLEDFGYFYLCLIIINFLGSFSLLGGTVSMAKKFHGKEIREQEEFISNIFFLSLIISLFFSLLTLISWDFFLNKFLIDKSHLYIMLFVLMIYGFKTYISEILTINNRPLSYCIFIGVQSITTLLVNIYLIQNYDFGVDTLFYSMLGSAIISLILIIFHSFQYLKRVPSFKIIKEILAEYRIAISGFLENLFIFFERNIINKFFGIELFTLFNYAKSYESQMLSINKAIVRGVYSAALFELKDKGSFSYCEKSIDYILLVILFFGLFFATIGYDFMSLISNDKFSNSSYFVCLLCIVRVFNNTNVAYNITILVKGKIKNFANIVYFDKLVLLILILLLVPFLQLKGLVIAYITSAIILKLYFYKTAKKFFDVPFLEKKIFIICFIISSILLISIFIGDSFFFRLNLFITSLLVVTYYFRFELFALISYLLQVVFRK